MLPFPSCLSCLFSVLSRTAPSGHFPRQVPKQISAGWVGVSNDLDGECFGHHIIIYMLSRFMTSIHSLKLGLVTWHLHACRHQY